MFDNVNLSLKAAEVSGVDLLTEIPAYFEVNGQHNFENGTVISGNLSGLKISVSKDRVNISEGSLCKWYLGDNFQTLTRRDTQSAIEKLSDILHLPFDRADVTRIDVAQNFIVRYDTSVYFNHLGNLNHYHRFEQKGSLYYNNNKKQLLFYDKIREQKAKSQLIPEPYNNRQTLRYEMRYKKRLREQFNLPEIKAVLLYNESFYMGLVDRWNDEYKRISKINKIQISFEKMRTVTEFKTAGMLALIKLQGGELAMIDQINEARKRGDLTKKQAFDLRNEIKQACKTDFFTIQSDVITELNQKVNEAAKLYR